MPDQPTNPPCIVCKLDGGQHTQDCCYAEPAAPSVRLEVRGDGSRAAALWRSFGHLDSDADFAQRVLALETQFALVRQDERERRMGQPPTRWGTGRARCEFPGCIYPENHPSPHWDGGGSTVSFEDRWSKLRMGGSQPGAPTVRHVVAWMRATYPMNAHAQEWAAEIAHVFLGEARPSNPSHTTPGQSEAAGRPPDPPCIHDARDRATVCLMCRELAYVDGVAKARRKALEEAAHVCAGLMPPPDDGSDEWASRYAEACHELAARIRALVSESTGPNVGTQK